MWQRCEKNGIAYYTLPHWAELGAEVYCPPAWGIFPNPFDGLNMALHVGDKDEDVLAARRCFMDALSVPYGDFVSIQQTHGKRLCHVTVNDRGRGAVAYDDAIDDTDGIYTNESDLFMATFYADCLPLAVFDPVHHGLGLAHAGWKGTLQNIGGLLIEEMGQAFGSRPEEMFFAMGAGIMPCCYEVDESFLPAFCRTISPSQSRVHPGTST